MKLLTNRDKIFMALTVLALLVPLFLLGTSVYGKYKEGTDLLTTLEPRFARLLGLRASGEKIESERKNLGERISQFVYASDVDATQAGNDAQQRVRSILSAAGLTVVSSQVLPTKDDQGFERITLSVRAEGELIHLQAALAILPSLQPVVLVDGINIQVIGLQRADKPQRLGTDLKLSVLHRKPA